MNPHVPNFTPETMREVAAIMRVAWEPWMQDWPIEVSDRTRIEEFLGHCERESRPELSPAMVEVLLVSLDEAFRQERPAAEILTRAAEFLRKTPELLEYWQCPNAESAEEMFAITPWLRSL